MTTEPMTAQASTGLTLAALQRTHVERQEEWCPDQKPDLSFRGNELGGECGEAQNVIKKLERERHGWRGSRDTVEHLGEELADVIHCAVLVAITAGIDLEQAVIDKFNATSEKNDLVTRIAAAQPAPELCDVCGGHGMAGHPDSGTVCSRCNGTGGVKPISSMRSNDKPKFDSCRPENYASGTQCASCGRTWGEDGPEECPLEPLT